MVSLPINNKGQEKFMNINVVFKSLQRENVVRKVAYVIGESFLEDIVRGVVEEFKLGGMNNALFVIFQQDFLVFKAFFGKFDTPISEIENIIKENMTQIVIYEVEFDMEQYNEEIYELSVVYFSKNIRINMGFSYVQ